MPVALTPTGMLAGAMKRMDREQFFERLASLDDSRLRKTLWNLYWRGTDVIRERIEAEIDPDRPLRQ